MTKAVSGNEPDKQRLHIVTFKKWVPIAFATCLLVLFIYVIGPMGLETEALKPMAEFIEENDINVNAYYYTEVDEFFEAERHMREYLKLVPGSR